MQIHFEITQQPLLSKILGDKDLHIGLDAARGKDRTIEVTYCIRRKDEVIKVDTISFKEAD